LACFFWFWITWQIIDGIRLYETIVISNSESINTFAKLVQSRFPYLHIDHCTIESMIMMVKSKLFRYKFSRSVAFWAIIVLALIAFYNLFGIVLSKMERTFTWCTIEQPNEVSFGETIAIKVHVHTLPEPAKLISHLRWQSRDSEKRSIIRSIETTPELSNEGVYTLHFVIPKNDGVRSLRYGAFLSRSDRWNDRLTDMIFGPSINISDTESLTPSWQGIKKSIKTIYQTITQGKWTPGIYDPTVLGWIVTIAYLFSALLCTFYIRYLNQQANLDNSILHKLLWCFFAIVLFFLSINKQLDLQTLLTQIGRELALFHGWYDERRTFQIQAIQLLATAGIAFLIILFFWTRKIWRSCWPALFGMAVLVLFVLLRAVSFHHVDKLLGVSLGGVRFRHCLELFGAFLVGFTVYRNWLFLRKR